MFIHIWMLFRKHIYVMTFLIIGSNLSAVPLGNSVKFRYIDDYGRLSNDLICLLFIASGVTLLDYFGDLTSSYSCSFFKISGSCSKSFAYSKFTIFFLLILP